MFEVLVSKAPHIIVFIGLSVGAHCLVQLLKVRKERVQQKRIKAIQLGTRLNKLRKSFLTLESKQMMLKELAVNYFNSLDPKSHQAIHELDKLMRRVDIQILTIEDLVEQQNTLSQSKAEKLISSLQVQETFIYPTATKERKATWEMRVEQLIKLSGQNIYQASERTRALGVGGRPNKFKKPTYLCLKEIEALD